jgi:hypothetical protein
MYTSWRELASAIPKLKEDMDKKKEEYEDSKKGNNAFWFLILSVISFFGVLMGNYDVWPLIVLFIFCTFWVNSTHKKNIKIAQLEYSLALEKWSNAEGQLFLEDNVIMMGETLMSIQRKEDEKVRLAIIEKGKAI